MITGTAGMSLITVTHNTYGTLKPTARESGKKPPMVFLVCSINYHSL